MLYSICNKLGETTGTQVSDADPKFDSVSKLASKDPKGNTIYAIRFDGKTYFAVYEGQGESGTVSQDSDIPADQPATPDEDTNDEFTIPPNDSSD